MRAVQPGGNVYLPGLAARKRRGPIAGPANREDDASFAVVEIEIRHRTV